MNAKKANGASGLRYRLFLIDDHPVLREGFAQLLNQQPDLTVCGQAEDDASALDTISSAQPDMAIVDVELKGSNGIEFIKRIRPLFPELRILAFSMHDEALYAERALRAGAHGYVMKQAPVAEVIAAIRQVLRGERYLSAQMQSRVVKASVQGEIEKGGSALDRLSDRELEVFHLIGSGVRTREIAAKLGLSIKTIESYRAHLVRKLNLQDGVELVHYAIKTTHEQAKREGG